MYKIEFSHFLQYDPVSAVCYFSLDLYDIRNTSYEYRMMENVPSGYTFQISSKDAQNRLFTGTVTLTNSIGTIESNINISEYNSQFFQYTILAIASYMY